MDYKFEVGDFVNHAISVSRNPHFVVIRRYQQDGERYYKLSTMRDGNFSHRNASEIELKKFS